MRFATQVFWGLLCTSVCASMCCSQTGTTQASVSNVEGKVVQEPGGQPVRKVLVRLQSTSGDTQIALMGAAGELDDETVEFVQRLAESQGQGTGDKPPLTTSTDAAGHFKFEGVPAGQYVVSIWRDGYVPVKLKRSEMLVTVAAGQDLSDLVYKMEAAGFITGKIVDADGDPLAGIVVHAVPKGRAQSGIAEFFAGRLAAAGGFPGMATTNDLGEYRIAGLRAGQYFVQASPTGEIGPAPNSADKGQVRERVLYAPTYYPGALEQKQASAVQVLAGGAATANFTLLTNRAYRVSGTVAGAGTAPGGLIILLSNNGQHQQQALGAGGKFDFASVQPGTYLVQVFLASSGGGSGRRESAEDSEASGGERVGPDGYRARGTRRRRNGEREVPRGRSGQR
jgi:hypothetical protein